MREVLVNVPDEVVGENPSATPDSLALFSPHIFPNIVFRAYVIVAIRAAQEELSKYAKVQECTCKRPVPVRAIIKQEGLDVEP
jgi:hypothetical protein